MFDTYILRNQTRNHDKTRLHLTQYADGTQHVAVRHAYRKPQVLGAAVVERGHDALGDLAIALVEEGLAAGKDLGGWGVVDVVAAVGG